MDAVVTELAGKFSLQVETIRKSEMPFIDRRVVSVFPALAINDTLVFAGSDVTKEDLEWVILREMSKESLP
jgi:Thioredoxin domain